MLGHGIATQGGGYLVSVTEHVAVPRRPQRQRVEGGTKALGPEDGLHAPEHGVRPGDSNGAWRTASPGDAQEDTARQNRGGEQAQ